MKNFKTISLQLRLTLLTASILILVALTLTIGSIARAGTYFLPSNYVVSVRSSAVAENMPAANVDFNSANRISTDKTVPLSELDCAEAFVVQKANIDSVCFSDNAQQVSYGVDAISLTVAAKKQFAFSSTGLMLLVILCGIVLTWFMAGRALKPVKALAAAVDTIDAHSLSTRLPPLHSNDEIQQLTDRFNHMLDKLEQAFTQQRAFSANAAHELKTPLAAIRTNLEVLQMDEHPSIEDYQETVSIISRNSDRLITLVNQLLELNEQQAVDLYQCIATEDLLQQLLAEQTVNLARKNLSVTVENHLPSFYGNEQLCIAALRNLLDNAVKYTHNGGAIQITLEAVVHTAHITVWNDSPSISPEQLPHIFEPFYRCDESRSNKVSGSGLGLSLVQTIVQRHNGSIAVESTPQAGTSFSISLPLQPEETRS